MAKVRELLDKMDAEILDKVNAKVMENDAFIKAAAQAAYDAAVEAEISKIKAGVEVEYATARAYLNELLEDEPKIEEKAEEGINELAQAEVDLSQAVQVEGASEVAGPEVIE